MQTAFRLQSVFQKTSRVLALIVLTVTLFVGTYGLNVVLQHNNQKSNDVCPSSGGTTQSCYYTIIDHISGWQNTFSVTSTILIVNLLIIAFAFSTAFLIHYISPASPTDNKLYKRYRYRSIGNSYRLAAFSDGTLHPNL